MIKKPAKNKLLKSFTVAAALMVSSSAMALNAPAETDAVDPVQNTNVVEQVDNAQAVNEDGQTFERWGRSHFQIEPGSDAEKFRDALADWSVDKDELLTMLSQIDEAQLEAAGLSDFDESDLAYLERSRKALGITKENAETGRHASHSTIDALVTTMKSHDAGEKALGNAKKIGAGVAALALLGGALWLRRRKNGQEIPGVSGSKKAGVSQAKPDPGVTEAKPHAGVSQAKPTPGVSKPGM